jgi:hypothetical protein
MSDIFISYAREDRARALVLADLFQKQGWSVWWDRNIVPGASFDQVIESELAAAKCVIVLWSKESVAANWVKAEAGEGAARGVLVPVQIENVIPPLEFRRLQTVSLADWDGVGGHPELADLLKAIAARINAPVRVIPPTRAARRWRWAAVALGVLVLLIALLASLGKHRGGGVKGNELVRTPNLGLEVWQQNQQCPMFLEDRSIVRVRLSQAPFEIRGPRFDGAKQICAWTDGSIFEGAAENRKIADVPFFTPGTGMADSTFGSARLTLENRAHNYFIGERIRQLPSGQDSIFISSVWSERKQLPAFPRLYLVVLEDFNHDGFIQPGELERLVLDFGK